MKKNDIMDTNFNHIGVLGAKPLATLIVFFYLAHFVCI